MVRQGGFQAHVAWAVNALGEVQRIDLALRIPVGQTVEPPVDTPNFVFGDGPLEQGTQACATTPDPERGLFSGEDASFGPLKRDFRDRLHSLHTVI